MSVLRNNAELAWQGAPPGAVMTTASWIGVWSAMGGGEFYAGIQISNSPSALALGEVYYIAASGLAITQTAAANETEAMAGRALAGRFDGTTYLAIHDGDPGTTGANEETDLARISFASGQYAITDT